MIAVRDPVERFASWYRHLGGPIRRWKDTFEALLKNGFAALEDAKSVFCHDTSKLLLHTLNKGKNNDSDTSYESEPDSDGEDDVDHYV